MELINSGLSFAASIEEWRTLNQLLGAMSQEDDIKLGLTVEQSEILFHMYCDLNGSLGDNAI